MITYDFEGRVAVVTGGAQGIGAAVASLLAKSGATVHLWDVDMARAQATAGQIGGDVVSCDVSSWDSVQAALATTLSRVSRIDILVNSAGLAGPNMPIEDYPNADWHRIIDVNLTGTYHVNKAVLPGMRAAGYGRIVNIASVAGKEGNPTAGPYSASKAGVIALTKSIAKEVATENIAVNCVTPAAARTAIFDQMSEEHIGFMLSKIPRGRFVEVDEIAHMIAWMVSEENSFTTGAAFDLSGGRATY